MEQHALEQGDAHITPDVIARWLASKRSTLWSTWAIDDEKGRVSASTWLYAEIESLVRFRLEELASAHD